MKSLGLPNNQWPWYSRNRVAPNTPSQPPHDMLRFRIGKRVFFVCTLKRIHFWLSNLSSFDSVWFSIQSYIYDPKILSLDTAAAWENSGCEVTLCCCMAKGVAFGCRNWENNSHVVDRSGTSVQVGQEHWKKKWNNGKWSFIAALDMPLLASKPRTAWCFERFMSMGVFESGIRPV